MDDYLIAAVNETLSEERLKIPYGKCYCDSVSPSALVIHQNEAMTRCAAWNLTNGNVNIILPISSDFVGESLMCGSEVLRSFIKFLITSKGMEGKMKIIYILANHLRLHPSCAAHATRFYEDLMLSKHDDFDGTTLLDYVLTKLENEMLQGRACVVNSRLSRVNRKKKLDDDFLFDEPKPKRSKRQLNSEEEELEPSETVEDDPSLKFFLLKFIAELLKHDFYSKCIRSSTESGNRLEKSLAGRIFIDFQSETRLRDDVTMRILEIYRNCDPSQQKIINEILAVIADLCLFLDSGKLTVEDNILEPKIYPSCHVFGQWFCQRVFRRNTITEVIPIVKALRPEWLRLFAAFDTLKRNWKNNIPKGLHSIFLQMESALQKIHLTELSNVLKTLNVTPQRSGNEEISAIQDELMSACRSNDVAILRKLSKSGSIDFELLDQSGCNILHTVSKHGSLECAKFLLQLDHKNINIDLKDAKGVTPLAFASQYNNTAVYQLLLEYGAQPLNSGDEKFEISSQSYDAIFRKKLSQETSLIIFHLLNAFVSTYKLQELLQHYEEAKKEEKIGEVFEKRNYKFFAHELKSYIDVKHLISRITQIKNVPVYIDVLKSL